VGFRSRADDLAESSDRPAGTTRITTSDRAAKTILLPKLAPLLRMYQDIKVDIVVDDGLTDIVAERYDARRPDRE
jgi:DNA-binding transcriptional LysR family regulator